MLLTLAADDELSATDLASAASVSPATASVHLTKLRKAGLISMRRSGRYAFYRLSGPAVGAFLREVGIDPLELRAWPRAFARPCLDRTERRPHLGGALGAALAELCFARGWIRADGPGGRVRVTPAGKTALKNLFGLEP